MPNFAINPLDMPPIDTAALMIAFRAGCARFGIDPDLGANSYQVAAVKADQAEAARRIDARTFAHKFNPRTWIDKQHAESYDHSTTEDAAIISLREQAAAAKLRRALIKPLREVHRQRGIVLDWIDLVGRQPQTVVVEVPLKT